jgi:tetrapyrrole methylase family protein/MazG family protein
MYIEEKAQQLNKNMIDMTLDEMDAIWNESKSTFK